MDDMEMEIEIEIEIEIEMDTDTDTDTDMDTKSRTWAPKCLDARATSTTHRFEGWDRAAAGAVLQGEVIPLEGINGAKRCSGLCALPSLSSDNSGQNH